MNPLTLIVLIAAVFVSSNVWAENSLGVAVDVTLSPAGSFKAETKKIKGEAVMKGGKVAAKDIHVDLRSLETGISLRDKHLKERLMVDKYPVATLVKAMGENGKGNAVLKLKGMELPVKGKYSVDNGRLTAKFKIHLPDLKIEGVRYMGVGVEDDVTVSITVPVKDRDSVKAAQK